MHPSLALPGELALPMHHAFAAVFLIARALDFPGAVMLCSWLPELSLLPLFDQHPVSGRAHLLRAELQMKHGDAVFRLDEAAMQNTFIIHLGSVAFVQLF